MLKKNKIAVIGLGSMGYGMATSLLRSGHEVWGFDVNVTQVDRFVEEGGKTGVLSEEALRFDIAVVVVLNAAQTESVLFGENGIVPHMKRGSIIMSCATMAPQFARKMATDSESYGVLYLDTPISGGQAKAAEGKITVMASGKPEALQVVKSVLDAIAENFFDLGNEVGAGSAMKAINQLLAGIHVVSMAEAMTFGIKQGIDPAKIVEVISQCAGSSWMFENRAPHVVSGDYTPHSAINLWPKDLGIVLDIARDVSFSAPLAAAALQQFLAAAGSGLGQEDDAAVAKVYARNANLKLPG